MRLCQDSPGNLRLVGIPPRRMCLLELAAHALRAHLLSLLRAGPEARSRALAIEVPTTDGSMAI